MEALLQLGVGFSIGLSGAMIPGPLFFYTVAEVLRKNQRVSLEIVLGHVLLEAFFIALIFFGLGSLLTSKSFVSVLSVIGGIALIAMGVLLISKAREMKLSLNDGISFKYGAILGGAFFSLVSPGFLVWWATIGVSLLLNAILTGLIAAVSFVRGHWAADLLWYWFVASSVERGKYYLNEQAYHGTVRVLALLLVWIGIYFAFGA